MTEITTTAGVNLHAEDLGGTVKAWTTTKRDTPKTKKAAVGELGTIARCLPGDVVLVESRDGKRHTYASIAWCWPNTDDAQAHLLNRARGCIDLGSDYLKTLRGEQRVRWIRVVAK